MTDYLILELLCRKHILKNGRVLRIECRVAGVDEELTNITRGGNAMTLEEIIAESGLQGFDVNEEVLDMEYINKKNPTELLPQGKVKKDLIQNRMDLKIGTLMAATPKPASTVVLMDELSRVYLTKRPVTMKFMGGFHVFPGGAVESHDLLVENDYIKSDEVHLSISLSHYIAAARELFEEVGILLGNTTDGFPVLLPKEKEMKYRNDLVSGEIPFVRVLEQERVYFDPRCLTYIGQITTPEESPIRFDTRFFLAKLPPGQSPEPDEKEIDGASWFKPEEALTAFQHKKIKLAPPTILTLQAIIDFQKSGVLKMSVTREDLIKLLKEL
jgi:8-oxo-dGTP pyrophosphatase MutT (NUDIX family)